KSVLACLASAWCRSSTISISTKKMASRWKIAHQQRGAGKISNQDQRGRSAPALSLCRIWRISPTSILWRANREYRWPTYSSLKNWPTPICSFFPARSKPSMTCGGFQILGIAIQDPYGIENDGVPISADGLGLLPIRTVLGKDKTVRRVRGLLRGNFFHAARSRHVSFEGYEIHVGETLYQTGASPLADIERQGITEAVPDGAVSRSG